MSTATSTTTTTSGGAAPHALQSLVYDAGDLAANKKPSLKVLDQLLLPDETVYVDVPDVQTTWNVIRNMQIRGTYVTRVLLLAQWLPLRFAWLGMAWLGFLAKEVFYLFRGPPPPLLSL